MTMTGNDRFAILVLHCTIQRIFCLFAIKFSCNLDRTYCITTTYNFSHIESWGKSLHSVRKCCIFAPAIERTAFCASFGSSLKTHTGYK